MRKSDLDEMQVQRRNKIGNQAFMMLFYILMIDIGLDGFGFRWLKYPTNVFIIMLACMTYYLIRVIWDNAFVGPQNTNKPIRKRVIFIAAIAVLTAVVTILLSKQNFIKTQVVDSNDNGALILFVFSIVALLITLIVSIISKKQNSKDD
ncbi:MAG TPA: DUF6773 family protein [Ruminiclostridium sp.]